MDDDRQAPRVRTTSISSMSQLLLAGWAMLADSCPECGVPLMRSPDGTQLVCTNCGPATASPGRAANLPADPPARQQQPAEQEAQRMANGNGHAYASSSDDEADEGLVQPPPPLRTRLQPALAAIAAEPLHNRPGSSSSGALARAAQPAAAGRAPGNAWPGDASKAIADLMLEGWAMLADSCPRCQNPLLRSRDRQRIYCAGCQMPVVREGEQPQQAAAAAAAVAAPAAPAAPAAAARGTPAAQPSQLAAPVASGFQDHVPVVEAATAVVAAHLARTSTALQAVGAPPSTDASALVAHVQRCAEALQALSECRRSLAGHH